MTTSQSGKKEGNRLPVLARPDGKSRLFQISMKTYCLLADIRQYQQISKKWSETSRNAKIYEIIYPHLKGEGGEIKCTSVEILFVVLLFFWKPSSLTQCCWKLPVIFSHPPNRKSISSWCETVVRSVN